MVDGTGQPARSADVGIEGQSIVGVGDLAATSARRRINVDGRVIAPGFIDIHTHADFTIIDSPLAESQTRQGVTTNAVGNCGFSPFPVAPGQVDVLRRTTLFLNPTLEYSWNDLAGYAREVQARRPGINVVPQVGHGIVRMAVMEFENRPPTETELEQMRKLVATAMEQGAFGLSSGLIYAPGTYCDVDELADLAAVAHRYGGYYSSHIRNEGDGLLESVAEALEVGRRSGIPVQLSHHKATGLQNWGKVHESLALLDQAQQDGLDVLADQYPYTASSTTLTATLPKWALEGGIPGMRSRLADPAERARIRDEMDDPQGSYAWDRLMIAGIGADEYKRFEGQMLPEIAAEFGCEPIEAIFRLLEAANGAVSMVSFGMSEDDVQFVMRHPSVMIASDGWVLEPQHGGRPHPRSFGTYARLIANYVREQQVLSLEDAVHKSTALPARRLGLKDRGLIEPGQRADIAVFDPAAVQERATFQDPQQYATGFDWVLVNGVVTLDGGEITGATGGEMLVRR